MLHRKRALMLAGSALCAGAWLPIRLATAAGKSAVVAVSAEISHLTSLSDDAIITGISIALEDLNLGAGQRGFQWELLKYDNGSISGRGVAHLHELARRENLVGVFGGKFSPVMLAMIPVATELKIPLFAPWSAADDITAYPEKAPYVFRLSIRDGWAMSRLVDRATERGYRSLGLLAPNSSWGRSCLAAIERKILPIPVAKKPRLIREFYNWGGEPTLLPQYHNLLKSGADVLVLVANEPEAALLASELAAQPPAYQRLPVLSHWGISGGDTVALSKGAIQKLDLAFIQSFNFQRSRSAAAARLSERASKLLGIGNMNAFPAQVGIAHAYDLMMMIGSAISPFERISGPDVAKAMTEIRTHQGVIRRYSHPFAGGRRDALSESDIFFCRYTEKGEIRPEP
jgi:branched-chain amino acid transport system substrate-binding protein